MSRAEHDPAADYFPACDYCGVDAGDCNCPSCPECFTVLTYEGCEHRDRVRPRPALYRVRLDLAQVRELQARGAWWARRQWLSPREDGLAGIVARLASYGVEGRVDRLEGGAPCRA